MWKLAGRSVVGEGVCSQELALRDFRLGVVLMHGAETDSSCTFLQPRYWLFLLVSA